MKPTKEPSPESHEGGSAETVNVASESAQLSTRGNSQARTKRLACALAREVAAREESYMIDSGASSHLVKDRD